jgi:predicted N-acetyltransferase YhbS
METAYPFSEFACCQARMVDPSDCERLDLMNPVDILVRRAAADFADWEEVRALILEAFAYMDGRIDPPSSALRLTPQSMAADAASGALLLASRGSTLAGCVFVRPKQDALYIGKLAVRPGLQGSGIGNALVAAARAEARALGLKALELQTRIELTENHAAFARMGFIKTAETAHPGYARPTSVTMRAPV